MSRNRIIPKTLLIISIIIAGFLTISFGVFKIFQFQHENAAWIKTEGVIIELEKRSVPKDLSGDDYIPTIEYFDTNGNRLVSSNFEPLIRANLNPSNEFIGKNVTLIYNPENYKDVAYYHSDYEYIGVIIMMCIGLVVLCIGTLTLLRLNRRVRYN